MICAVSYPIVFNNKRHVSFKLLPIKSSELDNILRKLVEMTTTTKRTRTSQIADYFFLLEAYGNKNIEERHKIVGEFKKIYDYHSKDNPLRGLSEGFREEIDRICNSWGINIANL